jgi:adenylyl-sulfate kinase
MDCSPNVTWQQGRLSRERRWQVLAARGATVWLTGLPASGKSTLGAAVEERLVERGQPAYLLDGDNLRHGICGDLGFSAADRETNIQRVGELAQLFADSGTVAVVALVSPFEAARRAVRERHAGAGLRFFEVFVDTPLELCAARDWKGLYARARAGELPGFTGVDDPYEPPTRPDLRLGSDVGLGAAVEAVLGLLAGERPEPQKGPSR